MAGARPEHSTVIVNFVAAVRKQLLNSTCYVFSDNVQYRFKTDSGEDKTIIPDASINCRIKSRRGSTFIDAPRFVMEVLSDSTEKYDRGEKKELYRQQEVDEYWIVNWKEKQVEIYNLDYDENGKPQYYLYKTIVEKNKEQLKIVHFPKIKISFEELFAETDMEVLEEMNNAEIMKNAMDEFDMIQRYMFVAKEENATKTYNELKNRYLVLKALLNSLGVNLTDIDKIKE